jgi:hypothetical protein
MFFRPNFCSNCGERVERARWGVFTSRRFCQVCESEYKGQDLIPRAIVAGGLIFGIFGLGAYLKSGPAGEGLAFRERVSPVETVSAKTTHSPELASPAQSKPQQLADVTQRQAEPPVKVVAEEQYFCGAETKKGTPCSRRVKGNVRCYQHTGMPAMATAAKLRIK